VVGAIGFAVDAGLLHLLTSAASLDPVSARVLSFLAAVTATWALNRAMTFADRASVRVVREWGRYFGVSAFGAAFNFVVYLAAVGFSAWFAARPVAALALASALAMCVNYLGYKHLAFRGEGRSA
jgi:putative flippase GtrA